MKGYYPDQTNNDHLSSLFCLSVHLIVDEFAPGKLVVSFSVFENKKKRKKGRGRLSGSGVLNNAKDTQLCCYFVNLDSENQFKKFDINIRLPILFCGMRHWAIILSAFGRYIVFFI